MIVSVKRDYVLQATQHNTAQHNPIISQMRNNEQQMSELQNDFYFVFDFFQIGVFSGA